MSTGNLTREQDPATLARDDLLHRRAEDHRGPTTARVRYSGFSRDFSRLRIDSIRLTAQPPIGQLFSTCMGSSGGVDSSAYQVLCARMGPAIPIHSGSFAASTLGNAKICGVVI